LPPAGLWSDKTAEDSGCGSLRLGPAVPVHLTAQGSGRPGPPGGFRTSRFRTRPSGLMAGGLVFFLHPAPQSEAKQGFSSFFDPRSPCRLPSGCRWNLFGTANPVPGPTQPHSHHPSAFQLFSNSIPTLQPTSIKADKIGFSRLFLGLGCLFWTFEQSFCSCLFLLAFLILFIPLLSFFHP
jgi:hypothetical protein